jgi:hypothetical protein
MQRIKIDVLSLFCFNLPKAVISGWHLADHGLSAEDELDSMKSTINQLRGTISSAKRNSQDKESRVNVDL